MATDRKISELPLASAINGADSCVLVSSGADYQFAFSTLLQFVAAGINNGAVMSFGPVLPQNNTGKNGDVFVNTGTGAFAQKISGTWAIVYTIPSSGGITDGTVLYGTGTPAVSTGNNNDTYIDTLSGIFYKKTVGSWSQVFSMQTGPAGPRGNSILNGTIDPTNSTGVNGDFYLNTTTQTIYGPKSGGIWGAGTLLNGTSGATILSGTANPSSLLGKNGDFYINTSSLVIYGPKASGVWPAGQNLTFAPPLPAIVEVVSGAANPLTIADYQGSYAGYGNYPTVWFEELTGDGTFKMRTDVQPIITRSSGLVQSISFDLGLVPNGQIIIKA